MKIWDKGRNMENTIYRSKAIGEPPLMLAISVFCALTDAVAAAADYQVFPNLDAPATPEALLLAVDDRTGEGWGVGVMTRWLETLARLLRDGTPAMLVIVARVEGSGPREPGARMIVTDDNLYGTIGGGQLEFETLRSARTALKSAPDAFIERYPLGPELSQCCGGVVTVMYEPFTPADAAWVEQLCENASKPLDTVRMVEKTAGAAFSRTAFTDEAAEDFLFDFGGDEFKLTERLGDVRQPLWLFGAGHVGKALARALEPLPFKVTWVDGRLGQFPTDVPGDISTLEAAMPELLADEAPPGAFFIVMTHSHALDQEICEAVLRRRDFAYLGLIGSDTKAARFRSRLRSQDLEDADIAQLTCPIGLPGIAGKAPEVIAASVAADLLMKLEHTVASEETSSLIGGSLDV